jgi:hypothetical protein
MARPPEIEVVRRAYELWEQSGMPEGRDHEFYLQALHELQEALNHKPASQNNSDGA